MDPTHHTTPGEPVGSVPMAKVPGPLATEKAAKDWIKNAITHAVFVADERPSREASLAKTKLDEALMWAREDIRIKEEANS